MKNINWRWVAVAILAIWLAMMVWGSAYYFQHKNPTRIENWKPER